MITLTYLYFMSFVLHVVFYENIQNQYSVPVSSTMNKSDLKLYFFGIANILGSIAYLCLQLWVSI
jgi:hypothetical protein